MSAPSAWRRYGVFSAVQVEAQLTHLSRSRALTDDESERLEWAIEAQRGERQHILAKSYLEDLDLADRIEFEMHSKGVGDG